MPRWVKHVLGILSVMSVAACSGSSGCSSCSGVTPLPAGFDSAARIENAASVRITEDGFNFIESNIGALAGTLIGGGGAAIMTFPFGTTDASGTGYDLTICPDGPDETTGLCTAEIDLANIKMDLSTANPNNIVATGTVPLRLKMLPIEGTILWIFDINLSAALSGGGNSDCNPDTMTFSQIPVDASIAIEVERDPAHSSRLGYSKLRVTGVTIDQNALVGAMHFCGSGFDDAIVGALKGILGPMLLGSFTDTIVDTINDQLCMAPDPTKTPPCPNGSAEDAGKCMYPDGSCVSNMLGMDGNMDLGAALASISPGTSGGLDFLFAVGGQSPRAGDPSAAWGDLNPVLNGATLGMFGGVLPNPTSTCVTPVALDLPVGIPQPDELMSNTLPNWNGTPPHVGFALSERFLNFALGSAYNSGVLCLGVSTEQIDLLSTGLFALLVPSIKTLTHQRQPAPLAIIVRPQKPPTMTIGNGTDMETDPLMRLLLPEAMIDFYIWSTDRYVLAFTAQFDLDVPIGLTVSADGLTPVLEKIYIQNPSVTNSNLLKEDPATIATALAGVIEGLAGDFLGGLSAIDVSGMLSSLGLTLELKQDGIRLLTKGGDRFLGIFASLGVASQTASLQCETEANVVDKLIDTDAFRLSTLTPTNRPRVTLRATSSLDYGSNTIEYTYKLDNGLWHPWQKSNEVVVDDAYLLMQGIHTVAVKSRIEGVPASEDRTPTLLQVRIDAEAPTIAVERKDGRLHVDAWDIVSRPSDLVARYRFDDGVSSEWVPLASLEVLPENDNARSVIVDVRDEEGNIASAQQALIRGRPDVSLGSGASSACGCRVPSGSTGGAGSALLLFGLGIVTLGLRARSRKAALTKRGGSRRFFRGVLGSAALIALAGTWVGCSCSDDTEAEEKKPAPDAGGTGQCGDPDEDECIVLEQGLIGAYTSAAVAGDGTIWVSGYNEGDWEGNTSYGDLVVGKWNGTEVDWESVDGVPSEPAPDSTIYDVTGWRGGQDSAGPDVGTWTSLAVDASGNPRVAYFDLSKKALKFAAYDGTAWNVSTVFQQDSTEAGRYAKLLLIGGNPLIAFQVIESGDNGYARSKVVLARASTATPSGTSDWSFEDAAVSDTTPCRAHLCPSGQKCFADTLQCTATTGDCDPKCASGTACVNAVCGAVLDGTKLDTYPEAIGGYISIAQGPGGELGIVYYDRTHGNLMQARQDSGAWVTALLDGQSADDPPVDTGDVGIGAALAIDGSGTWHVAYVDGFTEALKYLQIGANGTQPAAAEIVDDGAGSDDGPFADGHHVVGDDASISVSAAGDVRIAYQDATAGTLRWSVGVPASGAGHDWSRKIIKQDGFAGFFPQQITVSSATQIVNWWRKGGTKVEGNVRVVSP